MAKKTRVLLAGLALLLSLLAAAPPAAARAPWRNMLREVNRVRVDHGLPRLRMAFSLWSAARRHSRAMVRQDYFAHVGPAGSTLALRLRRAHFVTRGAWAAAETLAWGVGRGGGARVTVRRWLRSPEHRAILLSRRYRLVGASRARGTFLGVRDARVWTADFAHR